MKNRNGFVSNSSSASFIVICCDHDGNVIVTDEEIKTLQKIGFEWTSAYYPNSFVPRQPGKAKPKRKKLSNLGMFVIVNEDDVIYELLKNNISFLAECQNCHVFYRKGDKDVFCFYDFGRMIFQGIDPYKQQKDCEEYYQKTKCENVAKWIEEYEKDMEEYKLNNEEW